MLTLIIHKAMVTQFKQNCVYDSWERMKLDMYIIRRYLESLPDFLPTGSEFYNSQVIELAKHWEIVADLNTTP